MSITKTPRSYEVGYGKPPKSTQFQKRASGNPRGRPKKVPDFDAELIRESKSLIPINDNGQRRRISKLQGVVKQLTNKAMAGNIPAARLYLAALVEALERSAQSAAPRSSASDFRMREDIGALSDEELMRIAFGAPKDTEQHN